MTENGKDINRLLLGISNYNDQNSLRELINHFYPRLYRIAYFILKDNMLAEEAIGDVFFRLWQMRHRMTDIKDINKYLHTSAKNNALVLLKREITRNKNVVGPIDEILEAELGVAAYDISPERQYLTEELKAHIESAISNLPRRCRNVFQLVKVDGLSYKAAADKLSVKPKTIENQLAIALKKLFHELEPYLTEKDKLHFEKVLILFSALPFL